MQAHCFPTQDSFTFGEQLNQLWAEHPTDAPNPTKVAVTLTGLTHGSSHTPSLFHKASDTRRSTLQETMDTINKHYGGRTLYYAPAFEAQRCPEAAPMRISFTHIPDLALERRYLKGIIPSKLKEAWRPSNYRSQITITNALLTICQRKRFYDFIIAQIRCDKPG